MMIQKSTKNTKFYSFKRQSSFGVRKFTIGVVSVSLGTALVATAPIASADTLETVPSELVTPRAAETSQVADKTSLTQVLAAAQAIDLSQHSPEVAEAFVDLFVRATTLLEQTGAEQAELDALTQDLQQVTMALTAEIPTAVGTPVEVAEVDAVEPAVREEEVVEEAAVAPEREAELAFLSIVPPKPIYPASQSDFITRTGARIDILTPDGQSMYSGGVPEAVDGGNGVNISRKVRIIVPEGATNQEITVNLGDQLTFLAGGALRVGDLFVDGQRVADDRTVTPKSVIYRPTIAPATIEFDVIFNVAPLSDNLRVLGLNSDPNLTASRVRQEALTTGGFVETLPLSVNYRFQVNEKQSWMIVGFNTLYFSQPIDKQPSQAERYKPIAVANGVTLGASDKLNPAQFVANHSDLPSDTKYEFTESITTLIAGTSSLVGIKVTFADASVATVYTLMKVRMTMSQQNTPEAQSLRVNRGSSLRPIDFIKNASSLPANTRYSWGQEPLTHMVGAKVAQIIVTYSDGSTDILNVRFIVR